MKSLKGTRTAVNLMQSFAGESQARMRYTYYASTALKEGYVQMSKIFIETAENEREHAKRFFKFLNNDFCEETVNITADFPVALGKTALNLKEAAAGEHEEHSDLYPKFADVAEEEGFDDIAYVFREIAEVEERHERRFLKLLANIENDEVFKKDKVVEWKCDNCGYVHTGESAPDVCPACAHGKKYFEVFKETY